MQVSMCSNQYLLHLFVAWRVKEEAVQRIPARAPEDTESTLACPRLTKGHKRCLLYRKAAKSPQF